MNPEDLASQSVRLKEEQLRREEEKLREIEIKVQREINEKRQELLAKEQSLRWGTFFYEFPQITHKFIATSRAVSRRRTPCPALRGRLQLAGTRRLRNPPVFGRAIHQLLALQRLPPCAISWNSCFSSSWMLPI